MYVFKKRKTLDGNNNASDNLWGVGDKNFAMRTF